MTGLANRALFMDRLKSVISHANRQRRPSGLLMIDMDGLKGINDTYGHRVGDAVIVEFGNRLKKVVRDSDTAARLGGDEFGVLLTLLENPEGVESAVKRIEAEIDRSFVFEGRDYPLKASIGSSLVPEDGVESGQVMEIADQRMYAAKHSRKSFVKT
jgi:diguanylate cyclase (GGDEF)-like protein